MFDKENVEKENQQFSSSILYVATAVYVGICAMVFGALYAKLPTFGEAFLDFMKDYGTILAGIPVLVAVIVAKQQLDANRRQHSANIRRSFKEVLTALNIATHYSRFYTICNLQDCMIDASNNNQFTPLFRKISEDDLKFITTHLDSFYINEIRSMIRQLDRITELYSVHDYQENPMERIYEGVSNRARSIMLRVKEDEKEIAEYWS